MLIPSFLFFVCGDHQFCSMLRWAVMVYKGTFKSKTCHGNRIFPDQPIGAHLIRSRAWMLC
jgi:hypothetical protein